LGALTATKSTTAPEFGSFLLLVFFEEIWRALSGQHLRRQPHITWPARPLDAFCVADALRVWVHRKPKNRPDFGFTLRKIKIINLCSLDDITSNIEAVDQQKALRIPLQMPVASRDHRI
jgi:hypothetical protein